MDQYTVRYPEPSDPHDAPALRHLPSHLRFWIAGVGLLVLDLWSKEHVFRTLRPDEFRTVIPGAIEFRRSLNDGAVFGSFTGYVGLFIFASVGALLFVLYLFANSPRTHRALHVSLAMILAGALGNLHDRMFMQADVVRFTTVSSDGATLIGKVTSKPDAPVVVVASWPEGDHPRRFPADEVTIHRQGVVRDFIKFLPRFPDWTPKLGGKDMWPWIFNVADAALVCGVIILLLHSRLDRRAPEAADTGT